MCCWIVELFCCKHEILNEGVMLMFRMSREKSDKEIMREIQAIMRQIASSITYLPCLDETCKSLELDQFLDKDMIKICKIL